MGDDWTELVISLNEIIEDRNGKKDIGFTAVVRNSAGKEVEGLLGSRKRLGQAFTVRREKDGRWTVNGSTLGLPPLTWEPSGDSADE